MLEIVKGKEVVQLYIGDEKCSVIRPVKELKDFQKIELAPGEEKIVSFKVGKDALKFFNETLHDWVVEPGAFKVYIWFFFDRYSFYSKFCV